MIEQWLEQNALNYTWIHGLEGRYFLIGDKSFIIIKPKDGKILDDTFDIILDEEEGAIIAEEKPNYLCFALGQWVFYCTADKIELNPLKYIGRSIIDTPPYPHLGIHGMYEICNGSRLYKDWCKKAKFLGINTLGIAEYNTLAGTLQFQLDCLANNIKPVLGITALVKNETNHTFSVKFYATNDKGWNNLLHINKAINVDNDGFVALGQVFAQSEGVICVLDRLSTDVDLYKEVFGSNLYLQVDPVQYKSDEKDGTHLLDIKAAFDSDIKPVLICDSYYLDKQDQHIKPLLNKIGKINRDNQSEDQYFKDSQQIYDQLIPLFKDPDLGIGFAELCVEHATEIADKCTFKIPTGTFYLPEYKLTEVEDMLHQDKDTLFWNLIDAGLHKKIVSKGIDPEVYIKRVEVEYDVIQRGGFIDYFLILADVISWATMKGILSGIGRGSAGGSLIAYLLGLTKLDPIRYNLIFERFLNEGRIGRGLPDIDSDFAGGRRDEVKRYMEERYGVDNVCSIGTYGTFKTKAAIRDLCRLRGVQPHLVNYYASMLEESNSRFDDVFQQACANPRLKAFVNDNYETINDLPLFLGQPKTQSVHAAGVIITPDADGKTLYDWMPVKKMDGLLISEWEGPQLEIAGFLKEDILGIKQLDKFNDIFELIKGNGKQVPDLNEIDDADPQVYELFCQGYNQDLFHFGSPGLTGYSQQVKPRNFEDLIAMIAVYRPGAMEFGAHEDYVKIKMGRKDAEYDYMLKDVTQSTFGLYIYQEQVMQACQILGGFSLTEADDIRKAMGKKIPEKIKKFKDQFVKEAINRGCPDKQAEHIWAKLEAFAGYGFNRAHAAAYALTGYFCQWLKHHFPIEYWTVSLQYASEDEIPGRINEISRLQSIKILSPDINKSSTTFISDIKSSSIYWSIGKVRNVGEVALGIIMEERNANGKFFSLEEFCNRIDRRKVNKTCIVNLILSGAFDELEKVKTILDRKKLLVWFFKTIKQDLPEVYGGDNGLHSWFWFLEQKRVSGSGIFEYEELLKHFNQIDDIERYYVTPDKILLEENVGANGVLVGILSEVIEKKSKKGQFAQLLIEHNNAVGEMTLWNESWEQYKDQLLESQGRMIAVSGMIVADKWRQHNVLHSHNNTRIQII